eukprot:CAMPEP_0182613364 /NCGR_PEP_ID=MMETSP1330-20130603/25095_1 /TAXON_ID=464278 /ORGANISM="Picochlorum sp., Strain RCC944" /LENGTH=108 /DNA_ID=CAMNT_0024833057 /DNA_START=22 /DNA_END=345 /DNA_ORIENTATION=-
MTNRPSSNLALTATANPASAPFSASRAHATGPPDRAPSLHLATAPLESYPAEPARSPSAATACAHRPAPRTSSSSCACLVGAAPAATARPGGEYPPAAAAQKYPRGRR